MAYAMNWWIEISTHSLTRRLTVLVLSHALTSLDFNSQPHKEADLSRASLQSVILISTHSLTRRLTYRF